MFSVIIIMCWASNLIVHCQLNPGITDNSGIMGPKLFITRRGKNSKHYRNPLLTYDDKIDAMSSSCCVKYLKIVSNLVVRGVQRILQFDQIKINENTFPDKRKCLNAKFL